MEVCLRRFCQRPRIATVWSLCPTFRVTSLILMCLDYKQEALMCSPCILRIPKDKANRSPCMLLLSRRLKSIRLDQHIVRIQGKYYKKPLHLGFHCVWATMWQEFCPQSEGQVQMNYEIFSHSQSLKCFLKRKEFFLQKSSS